MDVNTIQMGSWRKAKALNIELIDITVKSGIAAFAPNYEMVLSHKSGRITDEEYTKQYRDLMLKSYMVNTIIWNELIKKDKIALACYCHPERFCHRHLFVKYLEGVCNSHNVPFRFLGEIE